MSDPQDALERLIDSLGDALVAVDPAGRVTRLSRRAEALTGTPANEARGKPLSEVVRIVAAEDRRTLDDLVARALRGEAVARSPGAHALVVARGGAEHAVVDTAVPLPDESGAGVRGPVGFRATPPGT